MDLFNLTTAAKTCSYTSRPWKEGLSNLNEGELRGTGKPRQNTAENL